LLLLLLFFLLFLFIFLLFLTLVLILLAFVSHCGPLFSVVPHLLAARTPLWREFCLWVLSRFQLPSTTLSNPFDSLFRNIPNISCRRLERKSFSWPAVQSLHDESYLLPSELVQVRTFREVLPDQAV